MKVIPFKKYFEERMKSKGFLCIISAYLLFCLVSAVVLCILGQAKGVLMSSLYLLFIPLIFIAEYLTKIRLPELFTVGILGIAVGSVLGSCFNLYTFVPCFDTLLHGISGFLFACLGFALAERLFGKSDTVTRFFGCVAFACCFSLAIAVIWEIFEYTCTVLLGLDMMEDALISNINSYLLAGSHAEAVEIDGITKTVIHYGNGQTYIINGYLELGLIDTLTDMIICTVGAILFCAVAVIGFFKFPKINSLLIPKLYENAYAESPTTKKSP